MFFSAHFHHMFEQIKAGYEFKTALMVSSKCQPYLVLLMDSVL